jgi:hypothetical protein
VFLYGFHIPTGEDVLGLLPRVVLKGQANKITDSASQLLSSDKYDLLAMPLNETTFIPNQHLRELQEAANDLQPSSELIAKVRKCLKYGVQTFQHQTDSETQAVMPTNIALFRLLKDEIKLPAVECFYGSNLTGELHFHYALGSHGSEPEPTIISRGAVLVGSESKGVLDSAFKAVNQASQVAGDGANFLQALGLEHNECVVPAMLCTGDYVQFMGAHLLPTSYPVYSFLSRPFTLTSRADQKALAGWIVALTKHCRVWSRKVEEALHPSSRYSTEGRYVNVIEIDCRNLFLKPVRHGLTVEEAKQGKYLPYRMGASRVFDIFQSLHTNPKCRIYFNFPLGCVQMPGSSHPKVRNAMYSSLHPKFKKEDNEQSDKTRLRGTRYIVFPKLDDWFDGKPPEDLRQVYTKELKRAVQAMADSKVCHGDLRPRNVMWRRIADGIELKIVDFEDALLLGEIIPPRRWDARYPLFGLENDPIPATIGLDLWCMNHIVGFNESAHEEYIDFMQSDRRTVYQSEDGVQ